MAVRAEHAVKVYGTGDTAVTALDDVTVEFPAGRFTAIMGPSGSGAVPASVIGSVMLSRADSVGTRLKAWNTKPMVSRRRRVSCFSVSRLRSTSPMYT